MNSEKNFLEILKESKEEIESIKNLIIINKELINQEFEINKNSKILKYSPLTYCIEKKLSEISIFLIEQGANINYKTYPNEDYPLLLACRYNLEDVIKKLLLYDNLNINCLNKKNETCYTILLNNKNVIIYNLIINHLNLRSKKLNDEKKDNDNNDIYEKRKKKIMTVNNFSSSLKKNNNYNIRFGKLYIFLQSFNL